jgi:hypothetical protein
MDIRTVNKVSAVFRPQTKLEMTKPLPVMVCLKRFERSIAVERLEGLELATA